MSYVYFARVGEYVKIGFSYRPERRIKGMFSGGLLVTPPDFDQALPVELIHTISDCIVKDERRLHDHFADYRVEGEWFRATPQFYADLEALDYCTVRQTRLDARRQRAADKRRQEAA